MLMSDKEDSIEKYIIFKLMFLHHIYSMNYMHPYIMKTIKKHGEFILLL